MLGIVFGAIVGALIWVWDAPPVHIDNWRRGAAGERRTARTLRALERAGWHVGHDVLAKRGNRDHIVVGPSGVYLLDTKSLAGLVRVDGDVVAVDRLDDPRGSYRLERLASALRAKAARLKADLEVTAGRTLGSGCGCGLGGVPPARRRRRPDCVRPRGRARRLVA